MNKNVKIVLSIVCGLFLLLVLFRFYQAFSGSAGRHSGRSRGASQKVATDLVRRDQLKFDYEIVANVESSQTVDVVARSQGLLEEVAFLEGDPVKKNQVLARVDNSQPLANFYKVKSDLANARFTYYQLKAQRELTDVQARSSVDIAQADLNAAQAGVQRSRAVYDATVSQGKTSVAQQQADLQGARSQLRQSEVDFNQSKVRYERMLGLQRQGFASQADVQDAYADVLSKYAAVQAQQAAVEAAEKQVSNSVEQAKKDAVSARADIQTSRFNQAKAQAGVDQAVAGTSRSRSFEQQLRAQQSLVEAAEAELESAKLLVEETVLKSPVDGFVSDRRLDPGTTVSPGDVIMTVQAEGEVLVVAALPQEVYSYVQEGSDCKVTIDGLRGREFEAHIFRKDSAIDTASRQFNIRVKIDDPKKEVKPGMFARVLLSLGPSGEQLVVPTSALFQRDDEARTALVYRVVEGEVDEVRVSLGPSDEEKALVREGLAEGDEVVVQTAGPLRKGQKVATQRVPQSSPEELKVSPTPGESRPGS